LPEERAESLDELIYDLAKYGFTTEVVDLRDFDDAAQLQEVLAPFDVLWAAGGNTYVLRSEMRRSGFEDIVHDLLSQGMVYCGESAGAIVAGLSLDGTDIADDPELADEQIEEGLGLVDKIIVPHADNPEYIEYVNHIKKKFADDPRVVYLNDDQDLVISG
jgi:dipeptidase E